jgi:hypothetical protein
MNSKKLYYLIIFFILLSSCADRKPSSDPELKILNINLEATSDLKASELFYEPTFLTLETNDTCILSFIEQLIVTNDKIFIIEGTPNRRVFIFNEEGGFEKTFGFLGRGPGEFKGAKGLSVNSAKSEITYLEALGYPRLITTDFNGNIIKIRNKELIQFAAGGYNILQDSRSSNYVFDANRIGDPKKEEYSRPKLCIYDDKADTLYPVLYNSLGFKAPGIIHYHQIYSYDSCVYYKPYDWDTIYKIVDTRALPYYQLNYGKYSKPEGLNTARNFDEWVNLKMSKPNFVQHHTFWRETNQYYIGIFGVTRIGSIFYIFDKNRLKSKSSEQIRNDWIGEEEYNPVHEFKPRTVYNDILVLVHNPNDLIKNLERIEKKLTQEELKVFKEKNSAFVKIVSGLKEADNPVLGFYKLRSDIF